MSDISKLRVEPGTKFRIRDKDARDTSLAPGGKSETTDQLPGLSEKLNELQEVLFAGGQKSLLIVLQGIDTSGKDGTIRHVFRSVDPLGVRVEAFGAPTEEELAHDFLWRVHRKVPRKGEIVIFNRSHYEDVLVVRVRKLAPKSVWHERFDRINEFEKLLAESGTRVVKFFLHISKEEQRERLQARLDDPLKRWKFRLGDLEDRKLWDDYVEAYEEVLKKTSTEHAPWYVIPSDAKWFRNYAIASVLIEEMVAMKLKMPELKEDLSGVVVE
jgi:PPK2 family polyphosphate:nucleotide phosphotransferase